MNFCKYTVNLEFTSVEQLTPDLFSSKEMYFETEITKKKVRKIDPTSLFNLLYLIIFLMCSYLQPFVPQTEVRIFPSFMALFFLSTQEIQPGVFLAEVFNFFFFSYHII